MAAIIKHLRAQYYEAPMPVQGLRQYHISEQEIAGLWGTETCHPPLFNIPRHAHDLASFYLVLEGSLTEFYDRNQPSRSRSDHVSLARLLWSLKIKCNQRCARVLAGWLLAKRLPARTRAHRLGPNGCI